MMNSQTNTRERASDRDFIWGLVYLSINLVISVAAQFVLKEAMRRLGAAPIDAGLLGYLMTMVNVWVLGGLLLYASGIGFWLLCLQKLELSFAYPAATLQYVLIFGGAWWLFDEAINAQRLMGLVVIIAGVIILSLDARAR